jgi:hypothetical protein
MAVGNQAAHRIDHKVDGKFEKQSTPFGTIQGYGDDPTDNLATHFGMYLFEKYYGSMTYPQFREELRLVLHLFAGRPPRTRPVRPEFARNWPYPAEEFNQP